MKPNARNRRFARRGTAVVEAAVMAPLVVVAMLGMIEVGYAFMIRQTVTLASREGARAAALPGGNMDDVNAAVDATMAGPSLTGYTATSNIDSLGPTDTQVTVTVTLPFDRATFTGQLLGGGTFNISATTTMRREGIEESGGEG
jgi:Flp pilus assembly protein TadG